MKSLHEIADYELPYNPVPEMIFLGQWWSIWEVEEGVFLVTDEIREDYFEQAADFMRALVESCPRFYQKSDAINHIVEQFHGDGRRVFTAPSYWANDIIFLSMERKRLVGTMDAPFLTEGDRARRLAEQHEIADRMAGLLSTSIFPDDTYERKGETYTEWKARVAAENEARMAIVQPMIDRLIQDQKERL